MIKRISNLLKSKKYTYLIVDLLFIIIIILIVYLFIDYQFNKYLQTGDFRLHLDKDVIGDQFLNLISKRYSNNNFPFLSFYSVFYFLQFVPYHFAIIYIWFGIPTLLFLSLKHTLLRIIHFKDDKIIIYIFAASLSFYFAINPLFFQRIGHWTILHGTIFLPTYVLFLSQYLKNKFIINRNLWILPILLYLGAVTPQLIVFYFISSIVIYIAVSLISKNISGNYFFRGFVVLFISFFPFSHIVYPILIGYGQTRAAWEGTTTGNVLYSLSRNSNILTAISGTNFFENSIKFPLGIGTGFLIFFVCMTFYLRKKIIDKLNIILMLCILFLLVLSTGYRSFSSLYDAMSITFIRNFLWVLKDPTNTYWLFLIPLFILFSRLIAFSNTKNIYVFFISLLIVLSNISFLYFCDKNYYKRSFYRFVEIPKEYFMVRDILKDDNGRNLWLPYEIYRNKFFSKGLIYFPSPFHWLTKNKELTDSTKDYRNLISIIESEIFDYNGKNTYFLNWIIESQNLNIIIDENSIRNPTVSENVKRKLKIAKRCMDSLPNVYKYFENGGIIIYKSNLILNDKYYVIYKGQPNSCFLNELLRYNPCHVIFTDEEGGETNKSFMIKNIESDGFFTILNESFDENWLNFSHVGPKCKVNFASMLFEGENKGFYYRGEMGFKIIVTIQKIILLGFFIVYILHQTLFGQDKRKRV